MEDIYSRTSLLLGDENVKKLTGAKVCVCGLGGVGSYAAEALARSGVGELVLIDFDVTEATNKNRQLYALDSTEGEKKTLTAKKRIADINKSCKVTLCDERISAVNIPREIEKCDVVLDCIDDVNAKCALIERCNEDGIPILSCMGTGNRTDPTKLTVCDIYETENCPLAKAMRKRLRESGVKKLRVVFSRESALVTGQTVSSMVFVPASAGLLMAREVVFNLLLSGGEDF